MSSAVLLFFGGGAAMSSLQQPEWSRVFCCPRKNVACTSLRAKTQRPSEIKQPVVENLSQVQFRKEFGFLSLVQYSPSSSWIWDFFYSFLQPWNSPQQQSTLLKAEVNIYNKGMTSVRWRQLSSRLFNWTVTPGLFTVLIGLVRFTLTPQPCGCSFSHPHALSAASVNLLSQIAFTCHSKCRECRSFPNSPTWNVNLRCFGNSWGKNGETDFHRSFFLLRVTWKRHRR